MSNNEKELNSFEHFEKILNNKDKTNFDFLKNIVKPKNNDVLFKSHELIKNKSIENIKIKNKIQKLPQKNNNNKKPSMNSPKIKKINLIGEFRRNKRKYGKSL